MTSKQHLVFFFIFFVVSFVIFVLMKAAERSVKVITMQMHKTLQNQNKLANSVKFDLEHCPLISYIIIKRYACFYSFEDFLLKTVHFLNLLLSTLFGVLLKMYTKYFPFTSYVFIKICTWSIIWRLLVWNWAFPEFIWKPILHLYLILKINFKALQNGLQ